MKDAGNAIQMYQERIERLEKALDLCREQRNNLALCYEDVCEEAYNASRAIDSYDETLEQMLMDEK